MRIQNYFQSDFHAAYSIKSIFGVTKPESVFALKCIVEKYSCRDTCYMYTTYTISILSIHPSIHLYSQPASSLCVLWPHNDYSLFTIRPEQIRVLKPTLLLCFSFII